MFVPRFYGHGALAINRYERRLFISGRDWPELLRMKELAECFRLPVMLRPMWGGDWELRIG